jgi:hypothetical protein
MAQFAVESIDKEKNRVMIAANTTRITNNGP